MRHGNKVNNLKRKKAHRVALLRNLSRNLIEHKRIFTTLAKAKALRVHVEPLITKSKTNDTHNRRICFSYLQDKELVKELFEVVGPKVGDRPGGYTRIIKLPKRFGDAADMAMIELVDFNETYTGGKTEKKDTKKKRTRRSSAAGPKTAATATTEAAPKKAKAKKEEAPVEDEVVETPVVETPAVEEAPAPAAEADMDALVENTAAEAIPVDSIDDSAPMAAAVEETSAPEESASSDSDDLKKINGIGPAFEKRLNAMGIMTYADLANLTIEDAAKLEEKHDDAMTSPEGWAEWIDQAKSLMG